MKTYQVGPNDADQRLDRFLRKAEPVFSTATVQKSIRTRHVKVDGKTAKADQRLRAGQTVCWRTPVLVADAPVEHAFLSLPRPELTVVYEDDHILAVNKPAGLPVQPDARESADTLVDRAKRYLYDTGAWRPETENTFAPALAHRLDRNTAGLVLLAKTAEALRVLNAKIRDREIEKMYLCVALGTPHPPAGLLRDTLLRDRDSKLVSRVPAGTPGGKTALTEYRTLETRGALSLVECRLLTGRTHQIRVQMAGFGHPLLGDGKYGDYETNRRLRHKHQALLAYKLTFAFTTPAGAMAYLNGKTLSVDTADFRQRFFPSASDN